MSFITDCNISCSASKKNFLRDTLQAPQREIALQEGLEIRHVLDAIYGEVFQRGKFPYKSASAGMRSQYTRPFLRYLRKST